MSPFEEFDCEQFFVRPQELGHEGGSATMITADLEHVSPEAGHILPGEDQTEMNGIVVAEPSRDGRQSR